MFTEQEFEQDQQLIFAINGKLATDLIHWSTLLDKPNSLSLENESYIAFLWKLVDCYRGIKFTDDERLINAFKIYVKSGDRSEMRWFINYSKLMEKIEEFSKNINGKILKGMVLHYIIDYLDLKITFEILSWGGIVGEHNGKAETSNIFKTVSNAYRRYEYSKKNKSNPSNEEEQKWFSLINEVKNKYEDYELSKKIFLKYAQGDIEKVCSRLILLNGIIPPQKNVMSKNSFYNLLFDFFLLFMKELPWNSFEQFIESCQKKSATDEYLSYEKQDYIKSYRNYKVRQVKSLLHPSQITPSVNIWSTPCD